MQIIEYNNAHNVTVEFLDKYSGRVCTSYKHFLSGSVKNPYFPEVYGFGMVGTKYPIRINGKQTKEYVTWKDMLRRCFNEKYKEKYPTYKDVTCCEEWLLYENFYEWLCSQENFEQWLKEDKWHLDKDILVKGNKEYNSENCCLVPHNVNLLFAKTKGNKKKNNLPIGVFILDNGYITHCHNPFLNDNEYLGYYSSIEKTFQAYKKRKEEIIKQVANIEYDNGNITEQCYEAMMNYKVEIND